MAQRGHMSRVVADKWGQLRGGRVPLTETLLPRIAGQGAVCLISTGGQARKARIEKFELDEGFQSYHPPFRILYDADPLAARGHVLVARNAPKADVLKSRL